MKKLIALAAVAAVLTGCTGFKKSKDGSFTYGNALFTKQFTKGKFTEERVDTNGVITRVIIDLEGFKSDGEKLAESLARGAVQGAIGKPQTPAP